jgi:hypothetical protein
MPEVLALLVATLVLPVVDLWLLLPQPTTNAAVRAPTNNARRTSIGRS